MNDGPLPAREAILLAIPALNEASSIIGVLERLTRNPPEHYTLRVCVVDGGSTDGTVELVRAYAAQKPGVFLECNSRRIQSAGVNLAVALHGEGVRWLVRCDAHANYPPDFLRLLIETQERTGAGSVVVPMDSIGCTRFQKAVAWVSDSLVGSGGSAHRGGHVSGFVDHGHHALISMDLFRRVGGYDESFTHNEDAEFDCRLRALGGTIYLDGRIRLEYHPRDSFHRLWRQYFNYGKGRSRTVRRHPTSLRPRQFAVPSFLALCLACLLAAPFRLEALLLPFVYCTALAATSLQVMLKHRSLCGLLAGPVAGVMHAAWACGFYAGLIKTREARWQPDDTQTMAKAA